MPTDFSETIRSGESQSVGAQYTCASGVTATFVGTCTATLTNSAGAVVSGYNAVNVDAQDTGPAAALAIMKQVDCSTGQIPVGKYEMLFRGTVALSNLPSGPDTIFEIIAEIDIVPATLG